MTTTGIILSMLFALGPPVQKADPPTEGDYRIGAGDALNIVVWQNEALSMGALVRPDGWITMPLLNDVQAEGSTPMQLQRTLTDRLSEYVSNPVVSVIVTEVGSFNVSVLGNVRGPGRYALNAPASVLDVLALAGGFGEFASKDETYILRPLSSTYQRIDFRYSQAISAGGRSINIDVKPGDIIVVP